MKKISKYITNVNVGNVNKVFVKMELYIIRIYTQLILNNIINDINTVIISPFRNLVIIYYLLFTSMYLSYVPCQ